MLKKIKIQKAVILQLNHLYNFEWVLDDFFVTDEQYPIKENEDSGRGDVYTIGICLKGEISIEVDAVAYSGGENYMLIAKPLQLFRIAQLSDDCRVRFISFSKRFLVANDIPLQIFDKFQFSQPNASPVIKIDEHEARNMVQQFAFIWQRFGEVGHPFRKEVIGSLLLVLLHDFEAIYRKHFCLPEAKSTRGNELARQFADLAQKHFRKEHSVDFYAKTLHITPKYLATTIKEITGRTASAAIAEALAIEAQALLRQTNVSVKEAANHLHFPDQSMFGRFFKRSVGISPLAYKKSVIQ